jgi:Na+/H+ antiporter NhaD/arsenite permease-like protein
LQGDTTLTSEILLITPFATLLLFIATGPLFFPTWWGEHYPKIALGLGAIVVLYYLGALRQPDVLYHTLYEYFSFIALIGGLYVVSGGISIVTKDLTSPAENVVFLFVGAILANLVGTTGASMLLIRPWIRMNKIRIAPYHIVFFIFIISNVGGALTPIGDPPLFLGYIKGVPFFWIIEKTFPMWCVGIAFLLITFFFLDFRNYRHIDDTHRAKIDSTDHWEMRGYTNLFFLVMILAGVFITTPFLLREIVILTSAAASYYTTKKKIHHLNHFSFHPIREVAILFAGIFATMIPALKLMESSAHSMGIPTTSFFFWNTGILSSFLDNAPTYLSFLSVAIGSVDGGGKEIPHLLSEGPFSEYLVAISVAAVFFGANTYIGNGPNFMVKSIAEHYHVPTPSFMRYITHYTIPVMLPLFIIIWILFFR